MTLELTCETCNALSLCLLVSAYKGTRNAVLINLFLRSSHDYFMSHLAPPPPTSLNMTQERTQHTNPHQHHQHTSPTHHQHTSQMHITNTKPKQITNMHHQHINTSTHTTHQKWGIFYCSA
jgi:hypothetical protein